MASGGASKTRNYLVRRNPLRIKGQFHGFLHHAVTDLRNAGEVRMESTFQRLMHRIDKYQGVKELGVAKQMHKNYYTFDTQGQWQHRRVVKQYDEDGTLIEKVVETSQPEQSATQKKYVLRKEKTFMTGFLGMLGKSGFRHLTKEELWQSHALSFENYRFKVGYEWLDKKFIQRYLPTYVQGYRGTSSPFFGTVGMFVRGEGSVVTRGAHYTERVDLLVSRLSSRVYYWVTRCLPWLARKIDPDVDGWRRAYDYARPRAVDKNLKESSVTSLLRTVYDGDTILTEDTFEDVILVFRRKRRRQALDENCLWMTGGNTFNTDNIEIRHYTDVPKKTIGLLLPEKVVLRKPVDFMGLSGSGIVLVYTAVQAVLTGGMSVVELAAMGAAAGYAYRIATKWQMLKVRYTQMMDALRDRNLKTTGTGTLKELHTDANTHYLTQACVVYYVLLKHSEWGTNTDLTAVWSSKDLEEKCLEELTRATLFHEKLSGVPLWHTNDKKNIPFNELGRRAINDAHIGGLGLWSFLPEACRTRTEEGTRALGLRALSPQVATGMLEKKWGREF